MYSGKCQKFERNANCPMSKTKEKNEIVNGSIQQYKQITSTLIPPVHANIPLQQYLLQNLLEKKRHKNKFNDQNATDCTCDINSEWIVRKRSNGERYVTKRNRRFDLSIL